MDTQEKIVCAAVKVARVKSDYKGVKIVIGVDYQSIYNDGVLSYLANDQDTNIWQNGFITSKNRFVDAKEAMRIAVEENQIEAIRKAFDAIPNFHDKGIDSHEFGEAANAAIDIRDEYLARGLKPEDLY